MKKKKKSARAQTRTQIWIMTPHLEQRVAGRKSLHNVFSNNLERTLKFHVIHGIWLRHVEWIFNNVSYFLYGKQRPCIKS